METRPKLAIKLTTIDKLLEIVCLGLLILLWVGTIGFFSRLPDQIPTHFNAVGKPDDFSSKNHIFVLPIVATFIFIGMTILNKYPHIYNYPSTVTKENAVSLYSNATKLIRIVKLMVVVIFSGIVFFTYKTSLASGDGLGAWFLPVVLLLLIIPIIFFFFKSITRQTNK